MAVTQTIKSALSKRHPHIAVAPAQEGRMAGRRGGCNAYGGHDECASQLQCTMMGCWRVSGVVFGPCSVLIFSLHARMHLRWDPGLVIVEGMGSR